MDNLNDQNSNHTFSTATSGLHWGHFSLIMASVVLLIGMSWMEKPELFSFHQNNQTASSSAVPHYYAYVAPATPEVLGASTDPTSQNQGPMLINEDGTVSPALGAGQVLGASTQIADLSSDNINVTSIPDSNAAELKFLSASQAIEIGPIDGEAFETALASNNQTLINRQAQTLTNIRDALLKLPVPEGLVTFDKLTILQYNSAIGLLQNFTQANADPELVANYLQDFMASQLNLETEATNDEQKYNLDPSLFAIGNIEVASSTLSDLQSGTESVVQQTLSDQSSQSDPTSDNSLSDQSYDGQ
jgi:hypothetical protein